MSWPAAPLPHCHTAPTSALRLATGAAARRASPSVLRIQPCGLASSSRCLSLQRPAALPGASGCPQGSPRRSVVEAASTATTLELYVDAADEQQEQADELERSPVWVNAGSGHPGGLALAAHCRSGAREQQEQLFEALWVFPADAGADCSAAANVQGGACPSRDEASTPQQSVLVPPEPSPATAAAPASTAAAAAAAIIMSAAALTTLPSAVHAGLPGGTGSGGTAATGSAPQHQEQRQQQQQHQSSSEGQPSGSAGAASPQPPLLPATLQQQAKPAQQLSLSSPGRLSALAVLSATYVHQAATSFSVPIMLPIISSSLRLSDVEGALLTSGHSYIYALALVPMGLLADRAHRPTLLGAGVALWSALGLAAGHASGFAELAAARLGMAVAQSTQNVVCFGMIPDLFPQSKSTALAVYNAAIYLGRGVMYLVFNAAKELQAHQPHVMDAVSRELVPRDASGNLLVPLDKLDLRLVQLVYTSGDMAAIRASSPLYALNGVVTEQMADAGQAAVDLAAQVADGVWRGVLHNVSLPGALLAATLMLAVADPRQGPARNPPQQQQQSQHGAPRSPPPFSSTVLASIASALQGTWATLNARLTPATPPAGGSGPAARAQTSGALALVGEQQTQWAREGEQQREQRWQQERSRSQQQPAQASQRPQASQASQRPQAVSSEQQQLQGGVAVAAPRSGVEVIKSLMTSAPFVTTTAAAALNDVASYAMIAWQSTFYERVYGLGVDEYAPVLATVLPLTGIVGGVGGGLLADRLSQTGQRWWVTVATTVLAGPLIWASVSAPTAHESFMYLGAGFALSEAWRAPSAVMARSVVPAGEASTAMSVYLCLRNVLGALGPLMVAQLSNSWGGNLQAALQVLPAMYLASALLFWRAEVMLAQDSGKWQQQTQEEQQGKELQLQRQGQQEQSQRRTQLPLLEEEHLWRLRRQDDEEAEAAGAGAALLPRVVAGVGTPAVLATAHVGGAASSHTSSGAAAAVVVAVAPSLQPALAPAEPCVHVAPPEAEAAEVQQQTQQQQQRCVLRA